MGDPKDVGQVDGTVVKNENAENVETINIDGEQNDQASFNEKLALNLKMAALLTPGVLNLPKSVRRTVRALKNLQLKHVREEVEFFKELHELEMKYEKRFEPLYEKRVTIVSGAYYPTEEECEFLSDTEKELELSHEVQKIKMGDGEEKEPEPEADIKGIPEFWLTAFKNAPSLADMIEEYDEPILKHLLDIKAVTSNDPMSFNLTFFFEPNEYFTNEVLTKYYELKCDPEEDDPFSFEGPEIVKCKGCTIEWKKGKNVTVKTVKKKQKHKARGAVRTITKTVPTDSFFNFFSPPTVPDNEDEELDEETQSNLQNDFEVGNLLKDRIIPHAVLFFTGENLIDDDFDEEDEEDEDEDYDENDDEEDEEDDDEDEPDNKAQNRKKSKGPSQTNSSAQAPPECKQQ